MPKEADKYAQFSPKSKLLKHEEWKILKISVRERYIARSRGYLLFRLRFLDGQLSPYMLEGKVTKEEFKDIAKKLR